MQQRITNLWNSGIGGKLAVIGAPILTLCCLCSLFIWFAPPPGEQNTILPTMTPILDLPPEMTVTSEATSMPASTDTPVPTTTSTSAPLGQTRDQPHPADTVIDIGGDVKLSIIQVTRPANDIVVQGNMFNDTPTPNQEYMLVRVRAECTKPANETCTFDSYTLKAVGADGTVRDSGGVAGIPEELEFSTEFFGGASIEGNLVFLIPAADPSVVLFYDPLFFGDPVYIALPQ